MFLRHVYRNAAIVTTSKLELFKKLEADLAIDCTEWNFEEHTEKYDVSMMQ